MEKGSSSVGRTNSRRIGKRGEGGNRACGGGKGKRSLSGSKGETSKKLKNSVPRRIDGFSIEEKRANLPTHGDLRKNLKLGRKWADAMKTGCCFLHRFMTGRGHSLLVDNSKKGKENASP